MRFPILLCMMGASALLCRAQPTKDYRSEMIASGEKQEKVTPEQYQSSPADYEEFLKAKAWNAKTTASGIFSNSVDLDIPSIGGRVRSVLVDTENDIALVAPSGGGLWTFDPATGTPFSPIDDLGAFLAITDIAQDPNDPDHILIATGDEIHNTLGNGLFQSTDGGVSFTQVLTVTPTISNDYEYIRFISFEPGSSSVLYMACSDKLFKSIDAGVTWTEVFDENESIRSLDFIGANGVVVGTNDKGAFKSTTGNAGTFSLMTSGIPNDASGSAGTVGTVIVASHAANRDIAYAFHGEDDNSGMYKTTDAGATWTQVTTPGFYIAQVWFCHALGVHPTNPNIVVAGSVGWGYSKDGGTTWADGADLEVDFHSIDFFPSQPDVAWIGYDQGFGSVDFANEENQWVWNGSEWVQELQPAQEELGKTAGFNTSQIYYGDYFPQAYGDAYLQGQQDGGCFGLVDGNSGRILVGDGGAIFIDKQNPDDAFACTQRGNLQVTTQATEAAYGTYNSAGSFSQNHPNWITQFDGNNADGDQLYMSDNSSIQRTLDGGANFTSIALHSLSSVKVAVQDAIDPVVYALGYNTSNNWNGDLIRIANAATSPAATTLSEVLDYWDFGTPDHIEIDPNDVNAVLVTGSRGNAYRISGTNTAIPTVTEIRGDIPNVVFNTVIGVEGEPGILIAGTNIGLFYSMDNGVSWTITHEIPYTQVADLKLRSSDNRLFVFTYGRGAWATTLNTQATNVAEISALGELAVYPNPVADRLNIEIGAADVEALVIYDQLGKTVLTSSVVDVLDVSTLTPGLYVVHAKRGQDIVGISKIRIE